MGEKLTGRDVVCPYFHREFSAVIACEAWWKGGTVRLCFGKSEEKKAYMAQRCKRMDGYKKCLVASVLEKKYGQ
ncbi:MAG: hypothetical protein ACI4MJ_01145 [Aristaeellaceae bacterium]